MARQNLRRSHGGSRRTIGRPSKRYPSNCSVPESNRIGAIESRSSNPVDRGLVFEQDLVPEVDRKVGPNAGAPLPHAVELPGQLQSYRNELIGLGIAPATVDRWLSSTTGFTANLGDSIPQPWLEHLQRSIARELRIGGPIRTQPGDRRVVALVGPTGVGKTTTVAKLAAGFRIEAKRRVGLLTIDTFRIAAVSS